MAEAAHIEVFILDLRRKDGSRFVTSAGVRSEVRSVARQAGGMGGQITHWRRSGYDPTGYRHPMDGWEMQERYDL